MASTAKRGQLKELQDKLSSQQLESKLDAIRRIIDAMTRGKDVSMLFMDVLKNMETPSLQLKKLIYLYVMSYAKAHPEMAILGTNTFRKDAVDKKNPFLRGLAVRTMGCIRIRDITVYLCDPLKKALKDQDPYVRKTGALCVPKLLEIAPELIQSEGFLTLLLNLLNDGNASVVSNAVAALKICSEIKGEQVIPLNEGVVQKLLTAMNDCNEWGAVYILDTLASYIPKDAQSAQNIMERVSSRLAHTNAAVAISSIKLIVRYTDYLVQPESIRAYNAKISAPLITMISREPEISYLVLKTINLVLQKRPLLLPKDLQIFYVNYHDPLYVKIEKLEVLAKIANNDNILIILNQLKEIIQEVDVEFVRKAVRVIGRCTIKLEKMADKCVKFLEQMLNSKIPYVVQETVVVMRDIFRKYPNKYEGLLADICENLQSLDDPQAKASIVWIIGEYVEMIENANQLMINFAENFKDEPEVVQHQILISCMKLYLVKPAQGQEILKDLFKYITKECENPDLRDRGYIYWRLLSTNPKIAKKVILSERPLISDQSYTLETELLNSLIQNIGTLSGVYYKQPEQFVKKLKDNANARQAVDEDKEELIDKAKPEQIVQNHGNEGQVVTYVNNDNNLIDNVANTPAANNLLEMDEVPQPQMAPKAVDNLLDIDSSQTTAATMNMNPIADLSMNHSLLGQQQPQQVNYSQMVQQAPVMTQSMFAGSSQMAIGMNIVIPKIEVLGETETGRSGQYCGLTINAAFQRRGPVAYLDLELRNNTPIQLETFALKLNANAFCLTYPKVVIPELGALPTGSQANISLELVTDQNVVNELDGWPYFIDCALKVGQQVFVFKVPCSMSVAMVPGFALSIDQYKEIASRPDCVKKQEALANGLELGQFVQKLKNNHLCEIFRRAGKDTTQLMSFGCLLTNKMVLMADIIFDTSSKSVNIQMNGPNENVLKYFNQALAMIVNL